MPLPRTLAERPASRCLGFAFDSAATFGTFLKDGEPMLSRMSGDVRLASQLASPFVTGRCGYTLSGVPLLRCCSWSWLACAAARLLFCAAGLELAAARGLERFEDAEAAPVGVVVDCWVLWAPYS